jgi:small subunit ribosomal protein S17
MAETEDKNETAAQEPPVADTSEGAAQEPPVADTPEAEAPAEEATPEATAEETAPEPEAAEEAAPEAEAKADEPAPATDAGPPEEELTPKQRRKVGRSRASGPARPQRSLEERLAERAEQRSRRAAERGRWRRKRRERARAAGTTAAAPTPPEPRARGTRKVRRGVVVSAKPNKTITVRIDMVRPHPRYGKILRNTSTLHAHDESNQANEGDIVRIVETRPLSRTKHWRLLEVVEKAR